jgi:hypothetical protein
MRSASTALLTVILVMTLGFTLAADPAAGSSFFPITPGASWSLTETNSGASMQMYMGGQLVWHGALCYQRTELIDGSAIGVTYWSQDAHGRILLHGLQYLTGAGLEMYFTPGLIYLDPTLQPGETITSQSHVFEVLPHSHRWWGELTVELSCHERAAVDTPLGTFAGITVNTAWTDSPSDAPWRYGHDALVTYAQGVGPARITGLQAPLEWVLVAAQNLDVTGVPDVTVVALAAAPNPFNPSTEISFTLPQPGAVRLDIHDSRGRHVRRLLAGDLPAGPHRAIWHGRDAIGQPLASGVYHAVLTAGAQRSTVTVTLVK